MILYLGKVKWQMFGKERTKGVRVRGSFDSRGRVSSHFFLYFVVVVVTFLLSSREEEEEEVDDDTGSLTRSKARVLPFFFSWNVRFLKILENSTKSAILNLGELMLFFQTNKSQLCSRPWVLAS